MIIFLSIFFIMYCLTVAIFVYIIKQFNLELNQLYDDIYSYIGVNLKPKEKGGTENVSSVPFND